MNTLLAIVTAAQPVLATVILGVGLRQLWLGLAGGSDGGLLRRRATAIQRMEGFRTATSGLVLIGAGVGWLTSSKLLVLLAIGIGVVELRESTMIIDAVKAAPAPKRPAAAG